MAKKKPDHAASRHFLEFVRSESFGGFLLLAAAAFAFLWANSPWSARYFSILEIPVSLGVGDWRLDKSLLHVVNDFLMAIFFLLVGLEIKREMLSGELASAKARWLPVAGALGGMVVPALFYAAFNAGGEGAHGWGIPMATDIAFALGVITLLGDRVPLGLKVFLTALAIVDDLGAVVVIAIFYTSEIGWGSLAVSLAACVAAALYGRSGGSRSAVYLGIGLIAWYFMLKSGVHATVAGVLIAMTVPATLIRRNGTAGAPENSPLQRLEQALHPGVAYLILPVFAFFNAGFALGALEPTAPVTLGVFVGLVLGKPLGICGAAWLVVRAGWAALPERTDWRAMAGAGLLGGIGFTMSLFVTALAFHGDAALEAQAKLGVFTASLTAAVVGSLVLKRSLRSRPAA